MNETSNPNTQIRNIQGWSKTLSTTFINRYVFPDGELDCVSNIQLGTERCGFEILASKRNRGAWSVPMTRRDLYVGQGRQPRGAH